MSIVVAARGNREGAYALVAAVAEAKQPGTDLIAVNLGHQALDLSNLDTEGVNVTVVDGQDGDAAENIFAAISEHKASRLIIGVKHRTPVGKAFLGSLSQDLLLNSPVPVLAVKPNIEASSSFIKVDAPIRPVTG